MAKTEYTEGVLCDCGCMIERVNALTSEYCPCCGEHILKKDLQDHSFCVDSVYATMALYKVTRGFFTYTVEYVKSL